MAFRKYLDNYYFLNWLWRAVHDTLVAVGKYQRPRYTSVLEKGGGLMLYTATVAVIEDSKDIADGLKMALEREGYRVKLAENGDEGVALVKKGGIDAVITDVMMPEIGGGDGMLAGFRAVREIRSFSNVPILFLTGKLLGEDNRAYGLDIGGDDYLEKPYFKRELIARIKALLRRAYPQKSGVFQTGDIILDDNRKTVSIAGADVHFSPLQFSILKLLMTKMDNVCSYAELESLWGYDTEANGGVKDSLHTSMNVIRKKIKKILDIDEYIETVPKTGYRIRKVDLNEDDFGRHI